MGVDGHSPVQAHNHVDDDLVEMQEWADSLLSLCQFDGSGRACEIMDMLVRLARHPSIGWQPSLETPYVNTIPITSQPAFPGNLAVEERLVAIMRWNALAMVVRANRAYGDLGGHIASYASAAELFEVGFNHFFRAPDESSGGDLVFCQPHSAPGIYARAFLEGRLSQQDLEHYRQEISAKANGIQGLPSYPHPWLMPEFWQFPTGSMGIGPINSIYQARFMRYLQHRGLLSTDGRTVWGVFGDGEMDEPESIAALTLAAREGLDNLVWVVNCNLQRLDGPVRGNGRIIDELECVFGGAGWSVIKLVWGSDWDSLFANDVDGELERALSTTVDGQFQTFAARDGRFNRDHFFGQSERLSRLAQGLTDDQIDRLKRGGHDLIKIYAAYNAAVGNRNTPTVILAQTKKGFGMGSAGEGRMATHGQKKLKPDDLLAFRDRFGLPLTDEQAVSVNFYKPDLDDQAMRYLHARRKALGGYVPSRRSSAESVPVPPAMNYARFAFHADGKSMSTTMAFVRMLSGLCKDSILGPRIVPIVADEARTFGMDSLFPALGIFLVGATSGRTTLGGEGLQHQDGSGHVAAATIPNCRAYDPAFAGELATIIDYGSRRMLEDNRDEFYYVTVTNEKYPQPSMPENVAGDIVKGLYAYADRSASSTAVHIRLLGSGAIMPEVIAASELLAEDWDVSSRIYSATSYTELARDAREVERWNRLQPTQARRKSHVESLLEGTTPVVAVADYVSALPQLIAPYIQSRLVALGTDGFGRSDTRAMLRSFFEIDRFHIVIAALFALERDGHIKQDIRREAIRKYQVNADAPPPWQG